MKKFRILSFILVLVLCASIFAGCGKDKVAEGSDTVVWYVIGVEKPDNQKVFDKANEMLKEKTGLTIDFKYIDQSQYDLMFSAGDEFDLILCPDWLGYWANVGKGAFQEITSAEFEEYAPYIWKECGSLLEASKYEGKYYAIPAISEVYTGKILVARGDYMDKYGIESLDTVEDIDEFVMAGAKDTSHNIVPFNVPGGQHWDINLLWIGDWGWTSPGILSYSYHYFHDLYKGDYKIFLAIDKPEVKQLSETVKRWYDNGVFSKSVLSNSTTSEEAFRNGKSLLALTAGIEGANLLYRDLKKIEGAEDWDVRFYSAFSKSLRKDNVMTQAVGISRTSKNKINALRALNAIYEDQELYRLLTLGVEGEHYTVGEMGLETVADSQYSAPALGITNANYSYPDKYFFPYGNDLREEIMHKIIDDPIVNCPIVTDSEYAEINVRLGDVTYEFTQPRIYGAVDDVDKAIQREKEALEQAGARKYVKFVQKKVDAYVESHPEAIEAFKESRKAVNEYNKNNPHKTNPKDYK